MRTILLRYGIDWMKKKWMSEKQNVHRGASLLQNGKCLLLLQIRSANSTTNEDARNVTFSNESKTTWIRPNFDIKSQNDWYFLGIAQGRVPPGKNKSGSDLRKKTGFELREEKKIGSEFDHQKNPDPDPNFKKKKRFRIRPSRKIRIRPYLQEPRSKSGSGSWLICT